MTVAATIPLILLLVWAFAAVPSQLYEAKAIFEFYPGHPTDAQEGLQATWALVPHDAGIGITLVPGKPHVYELSATRPEMVRATEQVNATVAAMEGSAHRQEMGTFRLIQPAEASSPPTYPRTHFLLWNCIIPLLLPFWVGGLLLAYRRRLKNPRTQAIFST